MLKRASSITCKEIRKDTEVRRNETGPLKSNHLISGRTGASEGGWSHATILLNLYDKELMADITKHGLTHPHNTVNSGGGGGGHILLVLELRIPCLIVTRLTKTHLFS